MGMTLIAEANKQCKKCFHFQVCSSVLKNDLLIREKMLNEKEPMCKMFVEVVLCKDCKFRHSSEFCECRPEGGFCNDGERKDND